MGMRILPLNSNIMLESNPLKSRIVVRRLAVLLALPWALPPAILVGDACWRYVRHDLFVKVVFISSPVALPACVSARSSIPDAHVRACS